MSRADRLRWWLSGIGQLMITLGVVLLLFCVYELWVTGLYTEQQQKKLDKQLIQTWSAPPPKSTTVLAPYKDGEGIARIYLPTLGKDQVHVVVEGVSHEDLKKGPGHVPGTDLPGQIGNMVISMMMKVVAFRRRGACRGMKSEGASHPVRSFTSRAYAGSMARRQGPEIRELGAEALDEFLPL